MLCFGAEAAAYRVELLPAYHAERPPVPDELARQWADAPGVLRGLRLDAAARGRRSRPTTCSARSRGCEAEAGGDALIFTGDRDMFQCVDDRVTVLFLRGGKDGPEEIDPDEVRRPLRHRARAGAGLHRPARRPVRRHPRRQGHRREDRARPAARARRPGGARSPARCASRARASRQARCATSADELRAFREIATLRDVDVGAPAGRADGLRGRRGGRPEHGLGRLSQRLEGLAR